MVRPPQGHVAAALEQDAVEPLEGDGPEGDARGLDGDVMDVGQDEVGKILSEPVIAGGNGHMGLPLGDLIEQCLMHCLRRDPLGLALFLGPSRNLRRIGAQGGARLGKG